MDFSKLPPPIFAVDDSPDDLFFLKLLLTKAGVTNPVVTFDRVETIMAFLEAAAKAPLGGVLPRVVFTDLKMPRINGLELLRWIRQHEQLSRLYVVLLTGSGEPRDRVEAGQLAVDRYLVKFPSPAEIADVLAAGNSLNLK